MKERAVQERWGKRELEQQFHHALSERTVLHPARVSPPVTQFHGEAAGSILKDSNVFEAGIPNTLAAGFGKGFHAFNLRHMRLFYQVFPDCDALRHELRWAGDGSLRRPILSSLLRQLHDGDVGWIRSRSPRRGTAASARLQGRAGFGRERREPAEKDLVLVADVREGQP